MNMEICKDLDELHPIVKDLALKLLENCREEGLNIAINETYRSVERQDYLYAQGRWRPGNIITHATGASMSSYHQWRMAFDIYNNVAGDAYNVTVLSRVGAIGEHLGLEWGGNWKSFKDTPHFQYTFGLSIADLRSGKRPPTAIDYAFESAVNLLSQKGIIRSPEAWINLASVNIIYTKGLILNMAKYINPSVHSHASAVKELQNAGIIGSPNIWLNTALFSINNIKSLIIKASKIL
jgi:hypothetical protein